MINMSYENKQETFRVELRVSIERIASLWMLGWVFDLSTIF